MKTYQRKPEVATRLSNDQIVQKKLDEINDLLKKSDIEEFVSKLRQKK